MLHHILVTTFTSESPSNSKGNLIYFQVFDKS